MAERGIVLPEALYTPEGIRTAAGLGEEALRKGRQAGQLRPTYKGNGAFYRGADLIAWILATGTEAPPRKRGPS